MPLPLTPSAEYCKVVHRRLEGNDKWIDCKRNQLGATNAPQPTQPHKFSRHLALCREQRRQVNELLGRLLTAGGAALLLPALGSLRDESISRDESV